jgi:hypothetical protein
MAPPAPPAPPSSTFKIPDRERGETINCYTLVDGEARRWSKQTLRGIVEAQCMATGSLRSAYKAFAKGSFYVVKFFRPDALAALGIATTDALVKTLQEEVVMQWKAAGLAHRWNAFGAMPKAVAFNPIVVVELAARQPPAWGVMEPLLDGAYVKYNDNEGRVFAQPEDGRVRDTPQAFSHFSYLASGGTSLVCDLQGVGDVFTDPQVHTDPRSLCPVPGNRGLEGIRDFFASHQCSLLCRLVQQKLQSASG